MKRWLTLIIMLLSVLCKAWAGAVVVTPVDSLMTVLHERIGKKEFAVGESSGQLYVRQYVELSKWNIGLNLIPDMTRFDRDENCYLTELFYDVHYLDYAIPTIYRRAHITTHSHGNGEMDRVMSYMSPDLYSDKIMREGYLSPLYASNNRYYTYALDTMPAVDKDSARLFKIHYAQRFDNIKLLDKGWILLDSTCAVRSFYAEGWDEQSRFKVLYSMGDSALRRNLVHSVSLEINYDFAGNRLCVIADGMYDYRLVRPVPNTKSAKRKYDLSGTVSMPIEPHRVSEFRTYATANRLFPLTSSDSAFYMNKRVFGGYKNENDSSTVLADVGKWLWAIGDGMVSSHSLNWNGGYMKMSPIINPSYLSYSSGRGLTYKMSLRMRTRLKNEKELSLKPMLGYNFKQGAFYWDVESSFLFDPMHIGSFTVDFGSGNRAYSSVMLDRIERMTADSLDMDGFDFDYFRNFYTDVNVRREIANGLELLMGVNCYKRSLIGKADSTLVNEGIKLRNSYSQFAPHVRITWQPGMYYYIKGNRKVNVGSAMPRFSLDVEQGLKGILGSHNIYTRAELDAQYKLRINESDVLFLRAGGGGYFYTKDVYFVDYAFLKPNNLPVERNDELGGVFQLLDSDWYNSANRYFRANVTFVSPFLLFQRAFPRVRFIKNECVYLNLLAISHLLPYSEIGYGIETPYIDTGFFLSAKNHKFHQVGYKITISLFRD